MQKNWGWDEEEIMRKLGRYKELRWGTCDQVMRGWKRLRMKWRGDAEDYGEVEKEMRKEWGGYKEKNKGMRRKQGGDEGQMGRIWGGDEVGYIQR